MLEASEFPVDRRLEDFQEACIRREKKTSRRCFITMFLIAPASPHLHESPFEALRGGLQDSQWWTAWSSSCQDWVQVRDQVDKRKKVDLNFPLMVFCFHPIITCQWSHAHKKVMRPLSVCPCRRRESGHGSTQDAGHLQPSD